MKAYMITGAGSGIGRAIARRLDEEGHRLYLVGRRSESLDATAKDIKKASCQSIPCDISDRDDCTVEIGKALEKEKNLYAVIANAGIGGPNVWGTDDRFDQIIATNLTGTYNFVNSCLPALRQSKSVYRHITIVSSILARLGVPGYTAYCASKAGVCGLMRSWAAELASDHILVNAVAPGWVETDMAMQGLEAFASETSKSYDEVLKEQMSVVPLEKMAKPSEVAGLVSYLTDQDQISVTGQTFDINNGALMP